MRRKDSRYLVLAALFAALTAVGALAAFQLPVTGVPFTLQVAAVLMSGAVLGARWGFWSQVVYLLLGAAGAPVFAQGMSGPGVLLSTTGGYLLSYPWAAGLTGLLTDRLKTRRFTACFLAMLPGLGLIYLLGAAGIMLYTSVDLGRALMLGVLPFIGYDLIKVVLAALVVPSLQRALSAGR